MMGVKQNDEKGEFWLRKHSWIFQLASVRLLCLLTAAKLSKTYALAPSEFEKWTLHS
jgi:hypothetical protein